tara:strand:- start:6765 stop:8534 length:1770 start_codon:yes stop_codon:yes gene_type:complete
VKEDKDNILPVKETEENSIEKVTHVDNNTLSMNELIQRVDLLSKHDSPYNVSKEIEEIKSIFYIKLKLEKEKLNRFEKEEIKPEKSNEMAHPLEVKFKSTFDTYRKIKSDFRKSKEQEEVRNLKIKQQIIEHIDELSKEEESLKITFEKFRILQEKWRNTGYVPITQSNHIWQSYNHHVELFYDFIKINKDLRDLDFKRNLEEKNEICKKAVALLKEKSINKAHNYLQELHEHWKNVGPVEREKREALWEKFQEISKKINKRRNDYFIGKKKEDAKKLEEKNKICIDINSLINKENITHKKWEEATTECHKLELRWRSIGRLNKEHNKIAWKKLRGSLDKFYNAKKNFYKEKKENIKQVIENKLIICEKAESLSSSNNWKKTSEELIILQKEWKKTQFVAGKQSDEIWNRFKIACDTFFKSRKAYYKKINDAENKSCQEKEALMTELEKFNTSSKAKEDIDKLNEFSAKWRNIGHIPRKKMNINDQFFNLLNAKFSELGLTKQTLEKEQYKNKVSSLKGNSKAINNERQFIKNKIEMLQKAILQYENNISFFGSGKATQALLKQAHKKINEAKSNIEELEQKIQLLNKS